MINVDITAVIIAGLEKSPRSAKNEETHAIFMTIVKNSGEGVSVPKNFKIPNGV